MHSRPRCGCKRRRVRSRSCRCDQGCAFNVRQPGKPNLLPSSGCKSFCPQLLLGIYADKERYCGTSGLVDHVGRCLGVSRMRASEASWLVGVRLATAFPPPTNAGTLRNMHPHQLYPNGYIILSAWVYRYASLSYINVPVANNARIRFRAVAARLCRGVYANQTCGWDVIILVARNGHLPQVKICWSKVKFVQQGFLD